MQSNTLKQDIFNFPYVWKIFVFKQLCFLSPGAKSLFRSCHVSICLDISHQLTKVTKTKQNVFVKELKRKKEFIVHGRENWLILKEVNSFQVNETTTKWILFEHGCLFLLYQSFQTRDSTCAMIMKQHYWICETV